MSCTFTVVPGCCEHDEAVHNLGGHCDPCWVEGSVHEYRVPVLCGHEESEHEEIFDGSIACWPCTNARQSTEQFRKFAGYAVHPFTAEVTA